MLKLLLTVFACICGVYAAICLLMYMFQRSLLYYPVPLPAHVDAETFSLHNQGCNLKNWHIPGSRQAILYFGGNAEDVSMNIVQFKQLFPETALYFHNYRGYGGSTCSPSEAGLFSDGLALYDAVHHTHKDITVIGRSLGSSVAVFVASQRHVQKLVLITPFDSMVEVAAEVYPYLPVRLMLKDRYQSTAHADQIEAPSLLLLAAEDEIISYERSITLAEKMAQQHTRVEIIQGAGHNTISSFASYEHFLGDFIRGSSEQEERSDSANE